MKKNESLKVLYFGDQIRMFVKWTLFLLVLVMVAVAYFDLVQVIDNFVEKVIDPYFLHTFHYSFSLKDLIHFFFQMVLPTYVVIEYIKSVTNKDFRQKMNSLYSAVSSLQLVILMVCLPLLIYLMNNVNLWLNGLPKEEPVKN